MFRRTNNGERGKDALGINWKIFTGCSQNRKSKIHKSSSQSTRINTWSKKTNPANLAHPAWEVEMLTDIFIFQKITSQMRKQNFPDEAMEEQKGKAAACETTRQEFLWENGAESCFCAQK